MCDMKVPFHMNLMLSIMLRIKAAYCCSQNKSFADVKENEY